MKDFIDEYDWIFEFSNTLEYSTFHYKKEWDAYRFMLLDKMYGMCGKDNNGNLIITLKGLPEENELLIKSFSSVMQGYYMNKQHWFSIKLQNNEFSKNEICNFIKKSYELIFSKLTKKQKESLYEDSKNKK